MTFFLNLILFLFFNCLFSVDIIGPIVQADGIGQISIGIFETIKNFKKTSVFSDVFSFTNISDDLELDIKNFKKNYNSDIVFFTNLASAYDSKKEIINNYQIKIACSLFETNFLPQSWVQALNNFDLIVVNCNWLIDVYNKSGVTIPIYNLNIPLPANDLIRKNINNSSDKFIFGMTAGPWRRKNHIKLIKSFKKTFANNNDVILKIHIRKFHELLAQNPQDHFAWRHVINYCNEIKSLVENAPNIEIIGDVLSREDYLKFMTSLNCLVLPSSGEGFSISPRESLALGLPTIISKNTSHLDLAGIPGVLFIPSDNEIPAVADFDGLKVGMQYDVNESDISISLREMYDNYGFYKQEALKNDCDNLKISYSSLANDYLTLIEPKQIVFSDKNSIDPINKIIYTNCANLLKKYNEMLNNITIFDDRDKVFKSFGPNNLQENGNTTLMSCCECAGDIY
jgi:glycosyltransferase involved in cell wall biosynthesis